MLSLQRIQNCAAKLVFKAKKRDHASPYLRQFHWLPIKARIEYKISSLVYKCFTNSAPLYLSELIHVYVPNRQGLRSANDNRTLSSIRINTLAGERGLFILDLNRGMNSPNAFAMLSLWRSLRNS